jgi:hypothetical protein
MPVTLDEGQVPSRRLGVFHGGRSMVPGLPGVGARQPVAAPAQRSAAVASTRGDADVAARSAAPGCLPPAPPPRAACRLPRLDRDRKWQLPSVEIPPAGANRRVCGDFCACGRPLRIEIAQCPEAGGPGSYSAAPADGVAIRESALRIPGEGFRPKTDRDAATLWLSHRPDRLGSGYFSM